MIRKLPLVLLSFVLACSPATTTAPPPRSTPAPAPKRVEGFAPIGTAQRVVLLSLDGLSADRFASLTDLPTFTWLRGGATSTARVIPVNPTHTSVTHTTILTGVQPDVHGVVSNRFHLPGTPMETTARGMDIEPDAPTLIDAAKRAGKRTGCISFPTLNASTPRRTCDFGMAWTTPVAEARTITLTRADFKREWVPPTWSAREQRRRSYSPVMRARVEWRVPERREARADVDFVVYDTTDDRRTNYDAIYVEADGEELTPDANGWFPIARNGFGSWSKVLTATSSLDRVTVYWGGISRTEAWPAAFRQTIESEIGFWPSEPDSSAEPVEFAQQSARLADYLSRVQTLALRMPADLLLMYLPGIDAAEHHHHDKPEIVRAAYLDADRAINAIARQLDWSRDALVITGDHGISAMTAEVRMNRLLAEGRFANWRAYASGSHAHLYRFGGADDADAVVNYLTRQPHFERVERKGATAHRNAGDVIVYAKPNVILSPAADAPAVAAAPNPGQHGGLNHHRELHTLFLARGAGIAAHDFGEISQTRIARFVARLIGMEPPAQSE